MDFTPGTFVALKVKFSIGSPDYNSPSKNKTLKLTKVLSESDVYLSWNRNREPKAYRIVALKATTLGEPMAMSSMDHRTKVLA
jgi:hypothetical protein